MIVDAPVVIFSESSNHLYLIMDKSVNDAFFVCVFVCFPSYVIFAC